jgi:hypothetical protein
MATKKKAKKKATQSKKTVGKVKPAKKQLQKRTTPKKSAKKKSARSKFVVKSKDSGKKPVSAKATGESKKKTGRKRQNQGSSAFYPATSGAGLGEQSGDLQGLSSVESADSESVDELIEEGNAFEAGVVSGVEEAGDRDEKEVRTREVPEDDVPGEYLDQE